MYGYPGDTQHFRHFSLSLFTAGKSIALLRPATAKSTFPWKTLFFRTSRAVYADDPPVPCIRNKDILGGLAYNSVVGGIKQPLRSLFTFLCFSRNAPARDDRCYACCTDNGTPKQLVETRCPHREEYPRLSLVEFTGRVLLAYY